MRSALRSLCRVSGSGGGAGAPGGGADAVSETSMAVIAQIVLCWYRASGVLIGMPWRADPTLEYEVPCRLQDAPRQRLAVSG
jgi:hypothetical protein